MLKHRTATAILAVVAVSLTIIAARPGAAQPEIPAVGACCMPTGDCLSPPSMPDADSCAAEGGVWIGDQANCGSQGCGACYLPSGECVLVPRDHWCEEVLGGFLPDLICGSCATPIDANQDGVIGIQDILVLLAEWGPCETP